MSTKGNGHVYIFGKPKPGADKQQKADAKRIAEAKKNIEKYLPSEKPTHQSINKTEGVKNEQT